MGMNARQEFTAKARRVVAERAGHRCSRPECRRQTIGRHSTPEESLSTGVAAHICAAAPGGPRYDPDQSDDERRSIRNAIWLCHTCSDIVDKDQVRSPKELLQDWKSQHEAFIAGGKEAPSLPSIHLASQRGLTLPQQSDFTLTGDDFIKYREHWLDIHNGTTKALFLLRGRIQFPENVVWHDLVEHPLGATVECLPDCMPLVGHASGGGSITIIEGARPAPNYKVGIDELPPSERLKVRFITVSPDLDIRPAFLDMELRHHIIGSFQYELFGDRQERHFFVALSYDLETRIITSSEPQDLEEAKAAYRIRVSQVG